MHHFLFKCLTWKYKRWFMGQALGRVAKVEDCVLNTQEGAKALFTYVGKTARLKKNYGEVPQLI